MNFFLLLVAAVTRLVVAQTDPSLACAAQNIVEACKATTQIQIDACAVQDWECLCNAFTNVLTCYNNCPGDPNRFGASQQRLANCNAAEAAAAASSRLNPSPSIMGGTATGRGNNYAYSGESTATAGAQMNSAEMAPQPTGGPDSDGSNGAGGPDVETTATNSNKTPGMFGEAASSMDSNGSTGTQTLSSTTTPADMANNAPPEIVIPLQTLFAMMSLFVAGLLG